MNEIDRKIIGLEAIIRQNIAEAELPVSSIYYMLKDLTEEIKRLYNGQVQRFYDELQKQQEPEEIKTVKLDEDNKDVVEDYVKDFN